jgi:hypothetical protein
LVRFAFCKKDEVLDEAVDRMLRGIGPESGRKVAPR